MKDIKTTKELKIGQSISVGIIATIESDDVFTTTEGYFYNVKKESIQLYELCYRCEEMPVYADKLCRDCYFS